MRRRRDDVPVNALVDRQFAGLDAMITNLGQLAVVGRQTSDALGAAFAQLQAEGVPKSKRYPRPSRSQRELARYLRPMTGGGRVYSAQTRSLLRIKQGSARRRFLDECYDAWSEVHGLHTRAR